MRSSTILVLLVAVVLASGVEAKKAHKVKETAVAANAVTDLTLVSTTATTATITFSEPAENRKLDGYKIHATVQMTDEAIAVHIDKAERRVTQVITGLIPSSVYKVTVIPMYGSKEGTAMSLETVQTFAVPPTNVQLTSAGRTDLAIEWDPALNHGNLPTLGSVIEYTTAGATEPTIVEIDGVNYKYDITGLTPSTTYSIAIATKNAAGVSEFTKFVSFSTSPSAKSIVTCGTDFVRRGEQVVCTIVSRDMNNNKVVADAADFVVSAGAGTVTGTTVLDGNVVFTYTAPTNAKGDEISVVLAGNQQTEISGSPVYIAFVQPPTVQSTITCMHDHAMLHGVVPCTIVSKDANGNNIPIDEDDLEVSALLGEISELSSADGENWSFNYMAPAGGFSDSITAVIADTGAALAGSPVALNLYGHVDAEQSNFWCLRTVGLVGKGVRCRLDAYDAEHQAIAILKESVTPYVSMGTVRPIVQTWNLTSYNVSFRAPTTGPGGFTTVGVRRTHDKAEISGSGVTVMWVATPSAASKVVCAQSTLKVGETTQCTIYPRNDQGAIYASPKMFRVFTKAGKLSKLAWNDDKTLITFTLTAQRKIGTHEMRVLIRKQAVFFEDIAQITVVRA